VSSPILFSGEKMLKALSTLLIVGFTCNATADIMWGPAPSQQQESGGWLEDLVGGILSDPGVQSSACDALSDFADEMLGQKTDSKKLCNVVTGDPKVREKAYDLCMRNNSDSSYYVRQCNEIVSSNNFSMDGVKFCERIGDSAYNDRKCLENIAGKTFDPYVLNAIANNVESTHTALNKCLDAAENSVFERRAVDSCASLDSDWQICGCLEDVGIRNPF